MLSQHQASLPQHQASLPQHAFLRASHSRNAAYIRIPGYRPTCSCMFVLPIAIALCLQAATRSAIAELLRQVIPGRCVGTVFSDTEVQMIAGGTTGRAYRRNSLPSDYDIILGHIQCRCMHIDRIQATAMVDHDVVPHGIAVGGCHHLTVVSRIDRRSFRCGEIHAIMELFNSQGRVDTVAVII